MIISISQMHAEPRALRLRFSCKSRPGMSCSKLLQWPKLRHRFATGILIEFNDEGDPSRKFVELRDIVARYQFTFTAIEKCAKPVIAAVHSAYIGASASLITECDIRSERRKHTSGLVD